MMIEQPVSDLAIPPGEFLGEVLDDLGLNQAELARRLGRPPQAINEIIKGEKAITPDTSIQLEKVLGVPAHIWSRLESEYRLIRARESEMEEAKKEKSLLKNFPYSQIAKLNLVPSTRKELDKVQNLRQFFGLASLFQLNVVNEYKPAFRSSNNSSLSHESLAAWLRAGAMLADNIDCVKYSKSSLVENLPKIRSLTTKTDPEDFFPELQNILGSSGVALVVIPQFKKIYTTGATFWQTKEKATVMMSLRGSWADIFWFSLFHELAHILFHDKRHTFLEGNTANSAWAEQEEEADLFAQTTLIPKKLFTEFVVGGDFSETAINLFAKSIGIAPGIVTGRLHHEGLLPYTIHIGRIRYRWS